MRNAGGGMEEIFWIYGEMMTVLCGSLREEVEGDLISCSNPAEDRPLLPSSCSEALSVNQLSISPSSAFLIRHPAF